jgi:hypothetical protein
MFTASESYSHTAYDLEDLGCQEPADIERHGAHIVPNQNWQAAIDLN